MWTSGLNLIHYNLAGCGGEPPPPPILAETLHLYSTGEGDGSSKKRGGIEQKGGCPLPRYSKRLSKQPDSDTYGLPVGA